MEKGSGRSETILCISYNQDQGCFAVGTESGFSIYNSDPFQEAFSRGKRK